MEPPDDLDKGVAHLLGVIRDDPESLTFQALMSGARPVPDLLADVGQMLAANMTEEEGGECMSTNEALELLRSSLNRVNVVNGNIEGAIAGVLDGECVAPFRSPALL